MATQMKITRRGIFGMFVGAVVGAKATPLVKPIPGGVALKLYRVPVVARARKLKATWTMECAKDLRALHGLGV